MIITKIRLQEEHPMSNTSGSWPLPFCDLNLNLTAGENGYLIKASEGLGPPDVTAIVEGFDSNGVPVLTSSSEKREIALRIGLKPTMRDSVGSLRDGLYKFMSRSVLVSLMNNSMTLAQTKGYIKKFETVHFTNQPEIQLTIECEDGEFSSPRTIDIPSADLDTATPVIMYEDGTAPTGLDLIFTCTGSHDGFTISNYSKIWYSGSGTLENVFNVDYAFLADDVVAISTQPKSQFILLNRDSTLYDLAGYVNAGAVWPKLYSGVNVFDWDLTSDWVDWTSASYVPKYWGV